MEIITTTTYVAFDGTEFNSREECEAYEAPIVQAFNVWYSHVSFLTPDMQVIFPTEKMEVEDAFEWFNAAIERCQYIKINEDLPTEIYNCLYESIGYYLPNNKAGLYKYDENDGWVRVD